MKGSRLKRETRYEPRFDICESISTDKSPAQHGTISTNDHKQAKSKCGCLGSCQAWEEANKSEGRGAVKLTDESRKGSEKTR
jgi:hypothetical protein